MTGSEAAPLLQVSVVIPSMGDAVAARAVDSVLASARACEVETEVIVVWQRDDPPALPAAVRVVQAHKVNSSYARNRGAEAARAPLIAMLDEDEVVDPRWVGEVVTALRDADAAFGPIDPLDDKGRPHCLTDHGEGRVLDPRTPFWLVGSGGNMAFRAGALRTIGGFDLRFGAAAIALSAEEADVIWRLLDGGHPIRWAPDMIVYHPTKTDAEILASRYPYGHGTGRLLRRTRSSLLIAKYLAAVAHANISSMRRRDQTATKEARAFGRGLLTGLVRGGLWQSPDLANEPVPEAIRAAIGAQRMNPLPVSWGARPHYAWIAHGAVLHAYVGPTDAQSRGVEARVRLIELAPAARIPAVHAYGATRDVVWVLEDRVHGEPLDAADPASWWANAADWVVTYAAVQGPRFGDTRGAEEALGWIAASPEELRPAVTAAVERLASQPTGSSHGDVQPKNLLRTPQGVTGIDWEWCATDVIRGADLLFLAVSHAGEPRPDVARGLLEGRNPAWGDVLGPLARLGLRDDALRDTIVVVLAMWACNEQRRVAALGTVPTRMAYVAMRDELAPGLVTGAWSVPSVA